MSDLHTAGERTVTAKAGQAVWQAEVAARTERELARTTYYLMRLRVIAAAACLGFAVVFYLFEPGRWQAPLLVSTSVAITAITIHDWRRFRTGPFTRWMVVYHLASIFVFQTAIILATGGIESPFIVIYLPVALIAAFAIARPRPFFLVASFLVVSVWVFALGRIIPLWPPLLPRFLGGPDGMRGWLHPAATAGLMTGVMLLGGLLGQRLRAVVDRAGHATAQARQEVVETMRERNRELQELAGALAHELKNPLASIQGLAGLLARRLPEGGREAEQAGVLLGEARRMGSVLDEFLNFSRPSNALSTTSTAPAQLCAEVVQLHEGLAAERGVTLSAEVRAEAPVVADARKVKQVLVNLLQNALDACRRGGRVTLRAVPGDGGGTRFEIDDDGPGIDASVRGRLFTPGVTSKAAGSGLGLVIARAIAEQHGGALSLEERAEGGVRAVFTLPGGQP
jgi:two-component system, NtrC family, sensor histidine kinase HydH